MEYEKAYVLGTDDDRPAKRRRIEAKGLHTSWPHRRQAYQTAWKQQRDAIETRLADVDAATVEDVSTFLDEAVVNTRSERIPTGIILQGADGGSTALNQIRKHVTSMQRARRRMVVLSANAGSNLKALLKALIIRATLQQSGIDEDEEDDVQSTRSKGPRLLNYDLQILCDHVCDRKLEQIVIAFEDTEAFDLDLLSELIELLGYWKDRIPFVCLFNIATDVDALQRLSRSAMKCLDGKLFDVAPSGEAVEQVLETIITSKSSLWLGAGLISMVLERQSDYIQSIGTLVDSVQYAYMSAYYANALSVFMASPHTRELSTTHFEAARSLPSFRTWVLRILGERGPEDIKDLLHNDKGILDFVVGGIEAGQGVLNKMIVALKVIRKLQEALPNTTKSALSTLYVQAMSGKLLGTPALRSQLLLVKKVPSDIAVALLESALSIEGFESAARASDSVQQELKTLLSKQKDSTQPLRSEDDIKNATLRTTVVAQKVELSKQKSALSEQDKAYTALLGRISNMFQDYFADTLINPKDLLFNEIFIYDHKSPYREVFTPRPRHAIERALASPHDYLDCDCCAPGHDGEEATLASTQPPSAVLYQLYLESGNLINASDLWQAFQAVMGDDKDEAETMALFQRGLAELRSLGMMKPTRKRADHVAKVMWRGL
ncbi:Origin recognition complex subunit 3 [Recurvomyces mirabilis]|uniref:Origin recognition complex subunit 3 n=1 Tax=Recurvomyces mirabilis TaxID=574656 RepID=A0AAE0WQ14_9PEZI|nr:Origin recognition complex subunit 3 [Recurvomyces mirabilis]KAK5155837.1 Origin recognition complex subunit 3 [Recurvomyces mirabilis]